MDLALAAFVVPGTAAEGPALSAKGGATLRIELARTITAVNVLQAEGMPCVPVSRADIARTIHR